MRPPLSSGRADLAATLWAAVLEACARGALKTPPMPQAIHRLFGIDHAGLLIAEAVEQGVLHHDEGRLVHAWRQRLAPPQKPNPAVIATALGPALAAMYMYGRRP